MSLFCYQVSPPVIHFFPYAATHTVRKRYQHKLSQSDLGSIWLSLLIQWNRHFTWMASYPDRSVPLLHSPVWTRQQIERIATSDIAHTWLVEIGWMLMLSLMTSNCSVVPCHQVKLTQLWTYMCPMITLDCLHMLTINGHSTRILSILSAQHLSCHLIIFSSQTTDMAWQIRQRAYFLVIWVRQTALILLVIFLFRLGSTCRPWLHTSDSWILVRRGKYYLTIMIF